MGGISPIVKTIGVFCGDYHGALLPSSNWITWIAKKLDNDLVIKLFKHTQKLRIIRLDKR